MVLDTRKVDVTVPRRRRRFTIAAVVAIAVAGVGLGIRTTSSTSTTRAAAVTAPLPSPGCGMARVGNWRFSKILGTGRQMAVRTAIVHAPKGYSGTKPLPLVFNMHGSGSSAAGEESLTGMDATSDRNGFVVVYPQAIIDHGTGYDWNVPGVPLVGGQAVPPGVPSDVAFLTGLVGIVSDRYCIDPNRVYATGFSGGARIASTLACDPSATFAAIAAVSGLRHPTPCRPSHAIPILAIHGTVDPVSPYAGSGTGYWTYSVPVAARAWAREDWCANTPAISHPAATVTLTRYHQCSAGSEVDLYTISGEGHQWAGGPEQLPGLVAALGPQSDAINADDVIWSFFASHPKA